MITFASLFREHLSRVSKWATAQGPLIFQARHLHWRLLSSHPSSDLLFVGWTISPERVSSAGVGRRLKCQWFEGHYHTGICFIGELSSQVLSRHKQTPNNQTKQINKIQTNKQTGTVPINSFPGVSSDGLWRPSRPWNWQGSRLCLLFLWWALF